MTGTGTAIEAASPAGSAGRDAAAAGIVAILICLAVAGYAGLTLTGAAGVVLGVGLSAAAGMSVMARPGRWSGPADRVTLLRAALIGGCATLSVLILSGQLPERPWWLVILLAPTLGLDLVDGAVARWTGTSSAAGRRLDGEVDAALLMVLSIAAVRALGLWVLAIGLMRYLFWAAGYLRPRLRGWLAFSQFRRVVAALQGVMLAVAMAPIVPLGPARAGGVLALALLTVSFGLDVITLERDVPTAARDEAPTVNADASAHESRSLRSASGARMRQASVTSSVRRSTPT